MDLLQLRYFQTVARLEHMTRAAQELVVSQPSLSRTIARLEHELGVPLFDRPGRQLRLNQFGRAYLKRVERIFAELEEGQRELDDMAGLERGAVAVAATTLRALTEPLGAFLAQHPRVRFTLFQATAVDMERRLERGEVDLCLAPPPAASTDWPRIAWTPVLTEEICLAVPPGHRLEGRDAIHLREVAREPFIAMKPGYDLRDLTDVFCRQAGFTPAIVCESDEPAAIRQLVAAGLGVAFLPASAWRAASERRLAQLHIEAPECQRTIGLAWREDRYLSLAAREFRRFVVEYFAQMERDTV